MSKSLKAIIKWTDRGGVEIQTIEGFDLPPRTGIDISFGIPLGRKPPGTVEEALVYAEAYKCMDCDFSTESLIEMMQHQKDWHSFKQKIKRALGF